MRADEHSWQTYFSLLFELPAASPHPCAVPSFYTSNIAIVFVPSYFTSFVEVPLRFDLFQGPFFPLLE
ncbi:hypothetical protein POVWA2_013720 [Plasmodium ovale wallikeri]|uniref:Uncharacterized protein n=1 Tax=Plasmodium ovale wallikeri TaxID=864142 RepID=A0A1A8YMZ0_PLAOA|nr:hypothetical protein POVWA1_013530 [Plasmodium ovale wallikeri]SBT33231.1 hypothetical protein POVWA2_013720 [Plasmodium ovale wallikeri]